MRVQAGFVLGLLFCVASARDVGASASVTPSDFRPVAVEGTARAVWVNPSAIGSAGTQSLVIDGIWAGAPVGGGRLLADDPGGISDLAYLSVAASTDLNGFAFRYEFDDVTGVPDWTLMFANRVIRKRGTQVGTALEWRGGEKQSVDATVSFTRSLGSGLRASLVLEDVFESDVDGLDGARVWRFGAALRPPIGMGYVSWDYERVDGMDEGQQWFALGIDRARHVRLVWATSDDGEWSVRAGLFLDRTLFSGGVRDMNQGSQAVLGSIERAEVPIVR